MVDYKFRHIIRDGITVKARVAFYEGEIAAKDEDNGKGLVFITRYRRSKFLGEEDFEMIGYPDDTSVKAFFNGELFKKGEPIAEQK